MPAKSNSELVAIERAAIITAKLCRGGTVTAIEVANLVECTERNAYKLLEKISRVVSIVNDDGQWFVMEN